METINTKVNTESQYENKFIIRHVKSNAEVRILFNPENTTAQEIISSLNNHYNLVEALTKMVAFYEGDANLVYIDKAKELLNSLKQI